MSVVPRARRKLVENEAADKFPGVSHLNVDHPAQKCREAIFSVKVYLLSAKTARAVNKERPEGRVTFELEVGEIRSYKVPERSEDNLVRKPKHAVH